LSTRRVQVACCWRLWEMLLGLLLVLRLGVRMGIDADFVDPYGGG
jgi:hypothetical protein